MRRQLAAVPIVVGWVAGCHFDKPGPDVDAPTVDPPPCFGVAPFVVCLDQPAGGAMVIQQALDIDTTACTTTTSDGACLIAAESIHIAGAVTVSGMRPLILLATDELVVDMKGSIDAASHAGMLGPAANPSTCIAGTEPGSSLAGGGGGRGGSFSSLGGNGGRGNSGATAGGIAGPITGMAIASLRGGCPGGVGSGGTMTGNPPGDGGGALYLLAGNHLFLHGKVDASGGAGGGGRTSKSGGSGGGSGGMIVLWSPTIDATDAIVFANGGGGGGGADNGAVGAAGQDPQDVVLLFGNAKQAALGGNGGSGGAGKGGAGAAGAAGGLAGTDDTTNAGGGGGGGGGGMIYVLSGQKLTGASVSPSTGN
jgi:hypothetical protein